MFSLLTKNWILSVMSYNYVLYLNSSSKTLTRPRSGWMEPSGYNYWIHKGVEIHIFQPWTSSGLCQLSAFQSWWILTVLFCFVFHLWACTCVLHVSCMGVSLDVVHACECVGVCTQTETGHQGFFFCPFYSIAFKEALPLTGSSQHRLGWCSVNS